MNTNEIIFFQVKMIRKGEKPPIWRRAYVPSNITFAQMALILEELLEFPKSDRFEFEFYQKKDRLIEWHEEDANVHDFYYDYLNAPDTYVNEWFLNEKWFTFRIRGRAVQLPEYRVEIEKALDVAYNETEMPLDHPILLVEKSPENDVFWKRRGQINDILEERYRLEKREAEYLYFAELLEEVEEKRIGLGFCEKMVNRDIHSKESPHTVINRLSEQFAEKVLADPMAHFKERTGYDADTNTFAASEEEVKQASKNLIDDLYDATLQERRQFVEQRFGKQTYEKATVEGILSADTKAELIELAQDFDLKVTGKRKDQLVFELARHLLEPDVMRAELLEADEEDLDAFESAMEKGRFLPKRRETERLDLFWSMSYMAVFSDGQYEVPEEVKTIYEILKRSGYREFHRKAEWMIVCLQAFDMIHVAAPAKVLYRMYRREKAIRVPYSEFLEIFDKIPEYRNPCCRIGETVLSGALAENNMYRQIMKRQRDVEYYIPSLLEIISYAEDGYPSAEEAYRNLFAFLRDEMGQGDEVCDELCVEAFRVFSIGGMPSDFMDEINARDIVFDSQRQAEQFFNILMQVNNHTRMFELRGHMPVEMSLMSPGAASGQMPTIVPMSSMAADMLEKAKDQIEARGFRVDTDSNAASIPVMGFQNGLSGEVTSGVKKVYPNDPCPCGSGKKYKKCCGRNRK
ncbi:MAG: SEC-C domain-containing protein [Clostridiales bacterium]|nr:SEC-C domain-containing protein [Clostridiales bacterium]